MQARKALGKGLASLIPGESEAIKSDNTTFVSENMVDIDYIIPNRSQPRKEFSDDSLKELAESIKTNGIIQPLIVTPAVGGRYELIAGERRLRAARLAGLEKVPVVVRQAEPEAMLELAIIENVQREDLNPIEEALAYKDLLNQFNYTQEEVADKVGKSRPYVANSLRLLGLPKVIQEDVILGRLTPGHARALLAISNIQEQLRVRESILHSRLTVRDVEELIQNILSGTSEKNKTNKKQNELSPQLKSVVDDMTNRLGTKVNLVPYKNNKGGKVIIEYYSAQDLNRIYQKINTN